jgi:hypothetical protein
MRPIRGFGVVLLSIVLAGCADDPGSPCSEANPCLAGMVCGPDGRCVPPEPLAIVNAGLAPGFVGEAYQDRLEARGGVAPYVFELEDRPGWMQLDPGSGQLSGVPDAPAFRLALRAAVRDSVPAPGARVEKVLLLDVAQCLDGEQDFCFWAEGGRCLLSKRTCVDGLWGDCQEGVPSQERQLCGPACEACDTARTDRCMGGICACGEGPVCDPGELCCEAGCRDPGSDLEHCGACRTRCEIQVAQAVGIACQDGRCDYTACRTSHLDCDGARENGCETRVGDAHCGACGRACADQAQNASGAYCRIPSGEGPSCDYRACEDAYLDCDGERANGCEQPRDGDHCAACDDSCRMGQGSPLGLDCVTGPTGAWGCGCLGAAGCAHLGLGSACCDFSCTSLSNPRHCGACGHDCLAAGSPGPLCLDPARPQCGCLLAADCGPGFHCCDQVCTPIGEENCADCGDACGDSHLGNRCVARDFDPHCGCAPETGAVDCGIDHGSWTQCKPSAIDGSFWTICACGNTQGLTCKGPDGQCCYTGGVLQYSCVQVELHDSHCGRCDAACAGGEVCVQRRCTCAQTPTCPPHSPAPVCAQGLCVCPDFSDGRDACPEGRICCDGSAGGTGGPGGSADLGCCPGDCGSNQESSCIQAPGP